MMEPIKLSRVIQEKAQSLMNQAQAAQVIFQTYIQGVMDAQGLDGNYNLDTNTWTLVPFDEPEGGE